MTLEALALIVSFSPLLGATGAVAGLWSHRAQFSQICSCFCMFCSLIASILLMDHVITFQGARSLTLGTWIHIQDIHIRWGIQIDFLSATLMTVVAFVSFLVHLYSVGYMSQDQGISRFMTYLSLFTFSMMLLVGAPNLVQLFLGWEGVGVCSYLLIAFWYQKPRAREAALKAFLVNRVGDVGLLLGIFGLFSIFHTLDFEGLIPALQNYSEASPRFSIGPWDVDGFSFIAAALFIGAMGKSAQFGLHVWLPDAMEGPTPVSALIHAATMVTAGIFLLIRLSFLYSMTPHIQVGMAWVGAITLVFGATVAWVQTDIKRVIAYSTCSQLGYMVLGVACGAPHLALFHLVTHAFFKALLFLGAGSVIHALSDEQDMRYMGGIARMIPKTYILLWIGSLALAGIPGFSGFESKEALLKHILHSPLSSAPMLFAIGALGAGLTALYSWRLLILVFHGAPRANERVMAHLHESPWVMIVPMVVLAIGAMGAGVFSKPYFLGPQAFDLLSPLMSLPMKETFASSHLEKGGHGLEWLPLVCAVLGIVLAFFWYGRQKSVSLLLQDTKEKRGRIYSFLVHQWYVNELYHRILVPLALRLAQILWKGVDEKAIDRWGPTALTQGTLRISSFLLKTQTGILSHYIASMMIGIIGWLVWGHFSECWIWMGRLRVFG